MSETAIAILRDEPLTWATDKPARPYVMYSELAATDSKAWLVQGLLGAGETSAAYGSPGCGKSALIEDMALHISARREWMGRAVTGGAVLYIALERRKLVERRAIAWRVKHGLTELPFAILGGVLDFRDPMNAESVVATCREIEELTGERVVLIVIDTLSRALCGGDENSPKDMGAIVTASAAMQQKTQAHVLWVHHMPHDSDRMRGHGALLGAMDTTLHICKGEIRTATVVKANDSEEGESVAFTLESVEIAQDGTTAPVVIQSEKVSQPGANDPKLTKNQQTMFAILHGAGAGGLTLEEWNDRAREAGIGEKRRADLIDIRMALQSKRIVRQYGDRWTVDHE